MWKYLNKGISTPLAIGIVLILVIAVSGFTWWQYKGFKDLKTNSLIFENYENQENDEIINNLLYLEVEKIEGKDLVEEGEIDISETKKINFNNESYLAVVFESNYQNYQLIKIYRIENKELVELFSTEEKDYRSVSFLSDPNFKDINNDGYSEIVLDFWSGGNCLSCNWIEIFQIRDQQIQSVEIDFPERVVPRSVSDLNEDGSWEVIGSDTHWEFYENVCHACSPSVSVVAAWEDGKYKIASSDFLDYYNQIIEELEDDLDTMEIEGQEEYYFGDLISLLLNYLVKGDSDKGIEEFKNYAEVFNSSDASFSNKEKINEIKNNLEEWANEEEINSILEKSVEE